MDNKKITYKIDSTTPLSIVDFTNAIIAMRDEYYNFTKGEYELYISEVRKGSFEVDFLPVIIPALFTVAENANMVGDFVNHIITIKNFLLGNNSAPSHSIEKASVDNTLTLINPTFNGDVYITGGGSIGQITKIEGKQVNDNYKEKLKELEPPKLIDGITTKEYKKVPFTWYQACFDQKKTNKGNKGIIANVQNESVNVIFQDDNSDTKKEMTTYTDGVDWQERIYIVDVEVIKKGDKVVKYKIIHNYMDESIVDEPNLFSHL